MVEFAARQKSYFSEGVRDWGFLGIHFGISWEFMGFFGIFGIFFWKSVRDTLGVDKLTLGRWINLLATLKVFSPKNEPKNLQVGRSVFQSPTC